MCVLGINRREADFAKASILIQWPASLGTKKAQLNGICKMALPINHTIMILPLPFCGGGKKNMLLNGDHYQSLKQQSLLKMHRGMDSGW